MKAQYILLLLAIVLSLFGASCIKKCQSVNGLDVVPLDAKDSTMLSLKFNGPMGEIAHVCYNSPPSKPNSEGVYSLKQMQCSAFAMVYNSEEPTAKELNGLFEIRNESDISQRVLLIPTTDITEKGVSSYGAWEEAIQRNATDVIREMNDYLVANNTRAADSLWNVLKAYNTRATVTLAPGETYKVLFQVR